MASSVYKDWIKKENLLRIQGWAKDGLDNQQIAGNIGISRQTLYKWMKKNPHIENALRVGKDTADRQVENAMFKNAIGYDYEEEMITNDGRVVKVKKHARANVNAQIFWLKNRKPEKWRDKVEQSIEHSGSVNFIDDIN